MNAIHINPAHKGALHRSMGIPQGQKISMADLMKTKAKAKASGNITEEKRATFAANAKSWNKGGAC